MISVKADISALAKVAQKLQNAVDGDAITQTAQRALSRTVADFYAAKGSQFYARFSPTVQDGFREAMEKHKAALVLEGMNARILAHKVNGGPIVPKRGKMLAIPLTPEARKRGSPSDASYPELFILPDKAKNQAFLARKWKGKGASKRPLQLWYLLVRSVMQKPHPDALPTEKQILDGVLPDVAGMIRKLFS